MTRSNVCTERRQGGVSLNSAASQRQSRVRKLLLTSLHTMSRQFGDPLEQSISRFGPAVTREDPCYPLTGMPRIGNTPNSVR